MNRISSVLSFESLKYLVRNFTTPDRPDFSTLSQQVQLLQKQLTEVTTQLNTVVNKDLKDSKPALKKVNSITTFSCEGPEDIDDLTAYNVSFRLKQLSY